MTKNTKAKIKKPNGIIYFAFFILLTPVIKVMFRLKVDRSGYLAPSGPFVVLCNHASFMDFVTVMLALYPHRLNAVVAQKYFFYKPLDRFLPFVGCIPKTLFAPDPKSIMNIMSVTNRGGKLLLFPEGRCTTGGGYMGMHKATGKLIKKLGVPVVACHIEGAYASMPFWRKGIKWGRQKATLTTLLTKEDTQSLSVDEINFRIDSRLSGADTASAPMPLRVLREKNLLEGLENILYYCPKCEQEFALETKGNTIRCTACGNSATMDRHSRLTPAAGSVAPETVHTWHKKQALYEKRRLKDDAKFIEIDVAVSMHLSPGKGIEPCGQGKITLDKDGWLFEGELSGKKVQLDFPIDTVPAVPFDPNDNFQIYAKGNIYAFTPIDNPQTCAKCATIGECAYWQFSANIQMTPVPDSGLGVGFPAKKTPSL